MDTHNILDLPTFFVFPISYLCLQLKTSKPYLLMHCNGENFFNSLMLVLGFFYPKLTDCAIIIQNKSGNFGKFKRKTPVTKEARSQEDKTKRGFCDLVNESEEIKRPDLSILRGKQPSDFYFISYGLV